MFQRLKGFNLDNFLDTKIAEEQAKQSKNPRDRSNSRRGGSNAARGGRPSSPSKKSGTKARGTEADGGEDFKAPDPEEFVIGDDSSDISRVATPLPSKTAQTTEGGEVDSKASLSAASDKGKENVATDELPEDVRRKLAKLEALTAKYHKLLGNYHTAHAKVLSIDPFEAALREHTPLTSIDDPGALVEFLNQKSLQSEMVLEELKRVTGEHKAMEAERDELKVKLDAAEQKARDAFDEAAGLREQRQAKNAEPIQDEAQAASANDDEFFSYETEQQKSLDDEAKDRNAKVEQQIAEITKLKEDNSTFRTALQTCQRDLDSAKEELAAKQSEVEKLRADLKAAQASTDSTSMADHDEIEQKLKAVEAELDDERLKSANSKKQEQEVATVLAQTEAQVVALQERLQQYKENLDKSNQQLQEKTTAAESNLKKYEAEHELNLKNGKNVQRNEKGTETLRNLVNTLRGQIKKAESEKDVAEATAADFKKSYDIMEAESVASGAIIKKLRHYESNVEGMKKKVADAEAERDHVRKVLETKKGHEAAVASLRSQLKRAEADRDAAYNMILDCGKCDRREKDGDQTAETSTQADTAAMTTDTPAEDEAMDKAESAEPNPADSKSKKKKKSKAKKKANAAAQIEGGADTKPEDAAAAAPPELSLQDIMANPEKGKEMLKNREASTIIQFMTKSLNEMRTLHTEERDEMRLHLEQTIEERDQSIRENVQTIKDKESEIEKLNKSIGEKEAEIETLNYKLKTEASTQNDKNSAHAKAEIVRLQQVISEKEATIDKLNENANNSDNEDRAEDFEMMQDNMIELAKQATDAKDALKTAQEQKTKLQSEFDELQKESDQNRKALKSAEARVKSLATEVSEANNSATSSVSETVKALEEQLANAEKEKDSLRVTKEVCEKQIEELKSRQTATDADAEKNQSLRQSVETLQSKTAELEKDLAAANQLAQTRFKDLTELREHLNKLQPELKKLREESQELKSARADLEKAQASVKKLEAKEKELRAEVATLKSQVSTRDTELVTLRTNSKSATDRSNALEESYEKARKDLEKSQATRDEATDKREKLQAEFDNAKTRLASLQKQVEKFSAEASALKEEIQLKSAQEASAQSQMDSLQNQTRELVAQMKELKDKNESLDEELADASRLLSERSREGDSMRRMLNEAESRAESRVKEMRERMDMAMEERDRAEDESSSIGRRKAREIEDVKNKLRDAEKDASRAAEARSEAERREREYKQRQDSLEQQASQAQQEVTETRKALAQLRETLDDSEKQYREADKERAELRRIAEEREARLDKLQKSSRTMAEELRSLRQVQSSRSSIDGSRVTSPAPRNGTPNSPSNQPASGADLSYLRQVLMQFLETKEKKHRLQLVPVLGKLLNFEKSDEQKMMSLISAK